MDELKGKVALVTGGGRGLGEAICRTLAGAGAAVVAADVRTDLAEKLAGQLRDGGANALAVRLDVGDESEAQEVVRRVAEQFGRLDVLVNNAGTDVTLPLEELSFADFDRVLRTNLRGPFVLSKAAFPVMRRQGGGVIINTSSVAGLVGVKNRAAYSASKMGVIGLTRSVAIDFIQDGIRANAICPGTVDTPSLRARIAASGDPETARAQFIARQPMGRLGRAEEIAALAVYLASDESAYMTGSEIVIDGGLAL
jgi:NAD(P)-dependent dehydrogenase (short-subunit alcohol dehydrogenase family)